MTEEDELERLRIRVEAQQRTIDALVRRVQRQDAEGTTSLGLTRLNHELERIVSERTEELRSQRETLATTLDLWEAVTSNLPDLLVQVDRTGRVVWTNRPAEVSVGVPLESLLNGCTGGVPADCRTAGCMACGGHACARLSDALQRALASAPGASIAFDFAGADGRHSSWRLGPVWHRGEVIGAVVLGRDVTAKVQTERELRLATAQIVQGQKLAAIGSLAAGVAHEINTPIQFVSDNTVYVQRSLERVAEVLDRAVAIAEAGQATPAEVEPLREAIRRARLPKVREQLPRAIEQSLEGLARVAKIVRAMKDFSHPSRGEKELVNLAEALESTATISRNEWKYVAELEIAVDPDLPRVPLLRDEFNQVVLNLIVNSAHAIAERYPGGDRRGRIRISAAACDREVEVRVQDDGNGIPDAVRDRVFEPFFTTKPAGSGTGLGAAIVWRIVEAHGGTIEVETSPGAGTMFTVRIPGVRDHAG